MSEITRRDFVNGTLMAAGASMLPLSVISQTVPDLPDPLYYPPSLTGLRGTTKDHTHMHMAKQWRGNRIGDQRLI